MSGKNARQADCFRKIANLYMSGKNARQEDCFRKSDRKLYEQIKSFEEFFEGI